MDLVCLMLYKGHWSHQKNSAIKHRILTRMVGILTLNSKKEAELNYIFQTCSYNLESRLRKTSHLQ